MESTTQYKPKTILEKLLLKYPDKDWSWNWVSINPNISIEFIEAHPDKPGIGVGFQVILT